MDTLKKIIETKVKIKKEKDKNERYYQTEFSYFVIIIYRPNLHRKG